MKFGVREICDVFLKAKVADQMVGNTPFAAGQPVCHFDSLKTSTVEGAATTVYAQGGKGNPRLVAWEGERTLTFTMEDALISTMGITLLTGAGLIEAGTDGKTLIRHVTEKVVAGEDGTITLSQTKVDGEDYPVYICKLDAEGDPSGAFTLSSDLKGDKGAGYLVDYYTEETSNFAQIDIEPNKFGGNYYLEASTLFRAPNGKDYPAEFIIPNCKIQSNFTFSMASSGDPSTFTYTIDAFPGVTKYDKTKKVLCAIQMFTDDDESVVTPASSSARSFEI